MRARQVLARNEKKIDVLKHKYQAAWEAARTLLQSEDHIGHQQLCDSDIRSLDETDSHASKNARKTLGKQRRDAEGSSDPQVIRPGESTKTLSWIWTGINTSEDSEAMKEATRVEWSKAWARKRRWDKELTLIEEEMRCTLLSLRYESTKWKTLVAATSEVEGNAFREGVTAYARRSAALRDGLAAKFETLWALPDKELRSRRALDLEVMADVPARELSEEENDNDELSYVA